MRRTPSILLALAAALAACGTEQSEPVTTEETPAPSAGVSGKADGAGDIVDGTPEGIGLLALLNAPETTFEVLDLALDSRAARAIVDHRDGPDGQAGTSDDDPFDDVAEIDAIERVGAYTLTQMLALAVERDFVPSGDDPLGTWDGVAFTVSEAGRVLAVVNSADETQLRVDVPLSSRAVVSIIEGRPIRSIAQLADAPWVGARMLERLKAYVPPSELFVISDIDKTLLPPSAAGATLEPPYPGVAALLSQLGDTFYVTARTPDRLDGIADWMADWGLPEGPIETGVSTLPWVSEPEKVKDISAILDAHPAPRFVLFGDSAHRDPEVYRAIVAIYGDRIAAVFIHRVNNVNPRRVEGMQLIENYADAAARLFKAELLTESEARGVIDEARNDGLELTDDEVDALMAR